MQRYYSNIYWHFTGSPKDVDWSKARKPLDILQQGSIRSAGESTEILKLIISSSMLKGTCAERISEKIYTNKFCCVTDIPLKDLTGHSIYYGRSAIGFRAESIHSCFLPVMYIPSNNLPMIDSLRRKTYREKVDQLLLENDVQLFESEKYEFRIRHILRKPELNQPIVESKIDNGKIENSWFIDQVKITDFSVKESESYYREREWRHIGDFSFLKSDIQAVVVEQGYVEHMKEFLINHGVSCPVLSWDFIERS
ncbi:abortive infection system antitoxin AbiGi family protein [Vibrio sp. M60_M31a]